MTIMIYSVYINDFIILILTCGFGLFFFWESKYCPIPISDHFFLQALVNPSYKKAIKLLISIYCKLLFIYLGTLLLQNEAKWS